MGEFIISKLRVYCSSRC